MTQARMRPMINCSTLGMSCSFALEPIREVEASSRIKSGWRESDKVAVRAEVLVDAESECDINEGGGTSSVS